MACRDEFVSMRSPVDERPCIEPDGIDDQRVAAFVVADRFAEPGRLDIGRMLVGQKHPPHHVIGLPGHQHFRRRLNEVDRLGRVEHEGGNAQRPAPHLRRERVFSGQRALTDVIPLQGGVPIKVGDVTIGGVGLSGAPHGGPQEEACGKAGVAKVADQLK